MALVSPSVSGSYRTAVQPSVVAHQTITVHRFDRWRGDLPIVLGHDHNPQRLDTSAASSEISSIAGLHRHGWLFLLQGLHHDIRPSTAQHIQHLAPIHAIMRDHHQRDAVAACHASKADAMPSPALPSATISDITQSASEASYSVG
jgi:hypothetical protein